MDKEKLQAILAYKNEDIISRFVDMFEVDEDEDEDEAEDIFTETKKFLYVCQIPGLFIPDELLIIDEMWHNFILFTKEYHRFCNQHFGYFFHHLPASKAEKEQQKLLSTAEPEKIKEEFNEKLNFIMGHVYDHLGQETLIKWFQEYPVKYSKANISALRKW